MKINFWKVSIGIGFLAIIGGILLKYFLNYNQHFFFLSLSLLFLVPVAFLLGILSFIWNTTKKLEQGEKIEALHEFLIFLAFLILSYVAWQYLNMLPGFHVSL
jgi:hypothetical protein